MTKTQKIEALNQQIHNVRKLQWNAAQMRSGNVCRLGDELDRLVDEKRRIEREGV